MVANEVQSREGSRGIRLYDSRNDMTTDPRLMPSMTIADIQLNYFKSATLILFCLLSLHISRNINFPPRCNFAANKFMCLTIDFSSSIFGLQQRQLETDRPQGARKKHFMKYEIRFATVKTAGPEAAAASWLKRMCLLREKRKKNPLNARRGQLCGRASGKGREREWVKCSASQMVSRAGEEGRKGEKPGETGTSTFDQKFEENSVKRQKAKS